MKMEESVHKYCTRRLAHQDYAESLCKIDALYFIMNFLQREKSNVSVAKLCKSVICVRISFPPPGPLTYHHFFQSNNVLYGSGLALKCTFYHGSRRVFNFIVSKSFFSKFFAGNESL